MKNQTFPDLNDLRKLAKDIRLDILETTTRAGSGHPSSSFSSVEILAALFFGGILRYRPAEPHWPERDRFILSKGHAAPGLYSVLSRAGYFPHDEIYRLRELNSPVQGHPIKGLLPGVESTNGSLGQGLSFGLGCALGAGLNGHRYRVYVLMGDGECQAGQIWEAAMAASHFQTANLVGIIDYNKFQECGPISREMALEPFRAKWESFGWQVEEVDGHSLPDLIETFQNIPDNGKTPTMVIAHTVKGKGVSFVEADYTFHGRALTPEQAEKAREEILSWN
ncbi:MAG TPA: transketolase [Atribacteraceae bacterium]|nr:transketolase [Atribacteraceae bacterium]